MQHVADILGDWREEIVTFASGELRTYVASIPATDRRPTLMQDRLYRNDVTHRSMGYPHVPMTSFFLGVRSPPARKRLRFRGWELRTTLEGEAARIYRLRAG